MILPNCPFVNSAVFWAYHNPTITTEYLLLCTASGVACFTLLTRHQNLVLFNRRLTSPCLDNRYYAVFLGLLSVSAGLGVIRYALDLAAAHSRHAWLVSPAEMDAFLGSIETVSRTLSVLFLG